jgi:hypothetical protein
MVGLKIPESAAMQLIEASMDKQAQVDMLYKVIHPLDIQTELYHPVLLPTITAQEAL